MKPSIVDDSAQGYASTTEASGMLPKTDEWTILDEDAALLTRPYTFAPKAWARTLVARFKADELLVMSPPNRLEETDYKALERFGRVTALVAPNGFHHLGLASWKQAFPDARIYAAKKAIPRIQKKQPALDALLPLAELASELSDGVELCDLPFFSIGEAWLKVSSRGSRVWYVSDSCFSMPSLPEALVVRLLFKWTGSAPGFRINRLGNKVFLRDKKGYKSWFLEQLRQEEPTIVVTAHGDIVQEPNLRATMTRMVEAAI